MLQVHSIETFGTHEGPGIRLVIFLQGCHFRCVYCHNPDSRFLKSPHSKEMSHQEILDQLEKQRPYFGKNGGLTISGGEPTIQVGKLIELFKKVKAEDFHISLDTCGAIYNQTINQLYNLTDLVILDVKHINEKQHHKLTGQSNKTVLQNANYREKTGQPMWLRYVLVPGWTDQEEHLHKWAEYFKDYKSIERIEILPYHTLGVYKYQELGIPYKLDSVKPPSKKQVNQAKQIFSKYLDNVYIR